MAKIFTQNNKTFMKHNLKGLLEKLPDDAKKNPIFMDHLKQFASTKVPYVPDPNEHVRATPLVEVLAVSIHSNEPSLFNDGEPCKIYGVVQVANADGYGTTVDLFSRGEEEPETVELGGSLSLHRSGDFAISPSQGSKLKVNLKDAARDNIEIAQEQLDLEFETEDENEVVKVALVNGKCGFAAVLYATLRSAVLAKVTVSVHSNTDKDVGSSGRIDHDVFGSIVACYRNKCSHLSSEGAKEYLRTKDVQKDYLSRVLFEKSADKSEHVYNGAFVGLSDSLIAVPAYSSLIVDLDLKSGADMQIVKDRVEFRARDGGVGLEELQGPDCRVKVLVEWYHAEFMSALKGLEHPHEQPSVNGLKEKVPNGEQEESHHVSPQLLPREPICISRNWSATQYKRRSVASPMMELFSIFIGHNNNEGLSLYGTIRVFDSFRKCRIFNRDKNSPLNLSSSSRTLSFVGQHECFKGRHLGMEVDLKDVESRLIVKGCFSWIDYSLGRPRSWYNRRICSVIRGEGGYAAVHYTIFEDAVQAKLKVSVTTKDSSKVKAEVCGTLVAQYSCCNYSSNYEKKYYRTVLFEKSSGTGQQVNGHSRVPLLRPVIPVPFGASLIIDVNLHVSPLSIRNPGERDGPHNGGIIQGVEHIRTTVEFDSENFSKTCESIEGQRYCIELSVKWGDIW